MAVRQLRFDGDPLLRKKSREVTNIDDRIKILIEDMKETMYKEDGVGLAAPQVGILRRVIVIDIGDGPIELINPELLTEEGEEIDSEGCLSIPGKTGRVKRPYKVKVKYLDVEGNEKTIEGTGLLARALCHEIDHLNGILFVDRVMDEEE